VAVILVLLALGGLLVTALAALLWFDHHLRRARHAVELGHNAIAVRHLKACLRARPEHREVLILSSRVARRAGAWDESESLLNRYWQLYGDDDELVLERLLLRATRGEVEAVEPLLLVRVSQGGPQATLAREALITGLIYRYRLQTANQHVTEWLAAAPESALAWLAHGKVQEARDATSEALLAYRRAVEIDPEHDEARLRMTNVLLRLSQGEEALAHLEYLRRRLPNNKEVLVQLARALDLQQRPKDAIAVLDECIRHHPDHAAALAERGRLGLRTDSKQAEEDLALAIRLDPGNLPARYQYHLALSKNGKKSEAAQEQEAHHRAEQDAIRIGELIKQQLQLRPDDPAIHHEIAMILLRSGRPAEALRWLHSGLQVGPNHVPTHRALSSLYHEMGNPILSSRHRAIAQRLGRSSGQQP
jgi:tetratricopeptide (TPR) repeat protein